MASATVCSYLKAEGEHRCEMTFSSSFPFLSCSQAWQSASAAHNDVDQHATGLAESAAPATERPHPHADESAHLEEGNMAGHMHWLLHDFHRGRYHYCLFGSHHSLRG